MEKIDLLVEKNSFVDQEEANDGTTEAKLIAFYASFLSIAEIGLGGLLHSLRVPFTGFLLSLNQIFLLNHAQVSTKPTAPQLLASSISTVAAVMKSLAPIGKKLMPMLAITVQGLLYTSGVVLFGNTFIGRSFGSCLASIWGFVQPILLYYCFFGEALFQSLHMACEKLSSSFGITQNFIVTIVIGCVAVKVFFALLIALYTPSLSKKYFEKYLQTLAFANSTTKIFPETPSQKPAILKQVRLAFKDLCKPLFLISFALTTLFFYFQESTPNWLVWGILRPLGLGFFYFFIVRQLPYEKLILWLGKCKAGTKPGILNTALKIALNNIKQKEKAQ